MAKHKKFSFAKVFFVALILLGILLNQGGCDCGCSDDSDSDGGDSSEDNYQAQPPTPTINVPDLTPKNTPPYISPAIDDIVIEEDSPGKKISIKENKHDKEDSPEQLKWSMNGGCPDLLASPTSISSDESFIVRPKNDLNGECSIVFTLTDSGGLTASQTVNVKVVPQNDKPEIVSSPPQNAKVGETYTYKVVARDIDGDTLTYSLEKQIPGMNIDPSNGIITWNPSEVQRGSFSNVVAVSDGKTKARQDINIYVS